jgi:hypothetical protein
MGRNTVNGKGNIPGFNTNVDIIVADEYEGYAKPISDPPDTWQVGNETLKIRWFNIFGIRESNSKKEVAQITYDVVIQRPQLADGTRLRVFYLRKNRQNKDEIVEITSSLVDFDRDHVKFTLDIGDPPIGMYP